MAARYNSFQLPTLAFPNSNLLVRPNLNGNYVKKYQYVKYLQKKKKDACVKAPKNYNATRCIIFIKVARNLLPVVLIGSLNAAQTIDGNIQA